MKRALAAVALVAAGCAPSPQSGDETALRTLPVPDSVPAPMQDDGSSYALPSITVPPQPTPRPRRASRGRHRSDAVAASAPTGDVWSALARCESGGDPTRVSSTGKYRGAFQFSLPTWASVHSHAADPTDGHTSGDPIEHSYAEQLAAAKRLQARSGWGQWPRCSRKLGLA